MTTSLKLTDAELELIESKRAEKQAAEDRKSAEEAVRAERIRKEAEAREARVASLTKALVAADTKNILVSQDEGKLTFELAGRVETVHIEEHRVSSGWRSSGRGMKYRLSGSFNNYSSRYYTNPKSVIKKIAEFVELDRNREIAKTKKVSLAKRSLEALRADYPNATVTFEEGYNYGTGRNHRTKPNRYKVETDNGSYTFTSRENNDDASFGSRPMFSVYSRTIGKNIDDAVRTMILG